MAAGDQAGTRLVLNADEDDLRFFLEETGEQLELLDRDLIRLEKEQGEEILQEIFRAAHTLKGASATIGHAKMTDLTHAMESVLDLLRKKTLAISTPVIDALLESLDALRVLRDEVVTLEDSGLEFGALGARLHALRDGQPPAGAAPGSPPVHSPAMAGAAPAPLTEELRQRIADRRARGLNVFQVKLAVDPTCPMPAVRLLQVLIELSANGEVLVSEPTEAAIEREEVGTTLSALFACAQEQAQVPSLLQPVSDIVSLVVESLADPEGGGHPEAEAADDRQAAAPSPAGRQDRRIIDLGPQARGKPSEDQLRLAAAKLTEQSKSVRIDVARLDKLMDLTGELVIDRGRLTVIASGFATANVAPTLTESLADAAAHLGRITTELQDEVMKSRMLPMEHVVNRFPRMVRDLAHKAGKLLDFQITGQETELDRSVIEEIGDPLIHLLRNAVDHGIEPPEERQAAGKPETGVIRLSTAHEESTIVIRVQDDGRGIDPERMRAASVKKGLLSEEGAARLSSQEAIDLIWAPGFSTAAKVTDVSGRGVGMDIVKTNIQKLNGSVRVQSEAGQGTTIIVRVPLSLAVIQGLVLRVAGTLWVMPISSVTETLKVAPAELKSVQSARVIQLRGTVLPIIDLAALLHLDRGGGETPAGSFVVAVRIGEEQAGFLVDELLGEQEVVIKNLGHLLRGVRGVSGATLMGDELALIADVSNLLQLHHERQRAA